jgi:SAM-dependent methyltransferase
MSVFGPEYSSIYDRLYADHDFFMDARAVQKYIRQKLGDGRHSLLDLGCGTGRHSALLKDDYDIVGVDASEGMLACARLKSSELMFHQGDVRTVKLDRRFDVVLMMSAVLGYQHTNEDVLSTMKNVRSHLRDGGLFIFDVWHGNAVLLQKPVQRFKDCSYDGLQLLRLVSPDMEPMKNCCTCYYRWWLGRNGVVEVREETHMVRYFFLPEVELFLESSGFKLLRAAKAGFAFQPVSEYDRDIQFVAQAC